MAIPRASIPQANIAQAQPLLAQFNAARAAGQGQPVPVIQGRGLDPAQLIQMAQGNALNISNTLTPQANQFIATDPAVDIRARERYLETRERDTEQANRLDNRTVYSADRDDARSIYNVENAKQAAELAQERAISAADLSNDRDIAAAKLKNSQDESRIERATQNNKDLIESNEALAAREKNFQLELAEHKDELARQLKIDAAAAEAIRQKALEGKWSGVFSEQLKKIEAYRGSPGSPGTRFTIIQGFKDDYLNTGVMQDPGFQAEFEQSAVYQQFHSQLGLQPGQKVPLNTPNLLIAMRDEAMKSIDSGGSLSAGFSTAYSRIVAERDAQMNKLEQEIFIKAIKMGVVPQAGGQPQAQSPQAPNPLTPQSGPQAQPQTPQMQGVNPGGNALAPQAPQPTQAQPQAPQPTQPQPTQSAAQPQPTQVDPSDPYGINQLGEQKADPNALFTNQQNAQLANQFEGLDEDSDGQITEAEIKAYVDNPLISQGVLDTFKEVTQRLVPGLVAANIAFKSEKGTALAESQMESQGKKLEKSPAPIDPDSVANESKTVTSSQKQALTKAGGELKSAQKTLSKIEKGAAKAQKNLSDLQKRRKEIQKLLGNNRNPGTLSKQKKQPINARNLLEKELIRNGNEIKTIQGKIAKGTKSISDAKVNVDIYQDRFDKIKGKEASYGKNPSQDKVRLSSDPDVKAKLQYNSNMRNIATKFGIKEEVVSTLVGDDGKISKSKLRDAIAKQPIGSVSKVLAKIFPSGGALKSLLKIGGKGAFVGAMAFGPDVYEAITNANLERSERKKLAAELKSLVDTFKQLNEQAGASNALTP